MDISSLIGLLMGTAFLLIAIAIAPGSSFSAFIDAPSAMVVIGGAISATLICFPLKSILGVGKVAKNVFNRQIGIAVYSPRLDEHGNSVRGLRVFEELAKVFELHLFDPDRPWQRAMPTRP